MKGSEDLEQFSSSYENELDTSKEPNFQYHQNPNHSLSYKVCLILTNLLYFAMFCLYPFAAVIISLIVLIVLIKEKTWDQIDITIFLIISSLSTSYFLICFFFFPEHEESLKYLSLDGLSFFITSNLVFSYLKTNYDYIRCHILLIFHNLKSSNALHTFIPMDVASSAVFLDYRSFESKEIDKYMEKEGFSKTTMRFSYFVEQQPNKRLSHNIKCIAEDFFYDIDPDIRTFVLLCSLILMKLLFCFYYILQNISNITTSEYVDMILMISVYFYITFILNRIVGNRDIKRKLSFMTKINQYIDFSNTKGGELNQKLDITCPVSLESWDNIRKFILNQQIEWLENLEISYYCFFVQFIFVVLICSSAYFEFYWIFQKESYLLKPMNVIIQSFNFLFLSCFFLIRLYEGNKFNDSFEVVHNNLENLIDIMEDLGGIYQYYFSPKQINDISLVQENKNSIIGIMIKKIKMQSKYYIKNEIKYEGKLYTKDEKNLLRQEIISKSKQSLEKIQRSLEYDSKINKYKFLNLVELNFSETLFTLLFAFVSTLPSIVPKMIEFYQPGNKANQ